MNPNKTQSAIEANKKLYEENLEEHGLTNKSVGWKDVDSQIIRFEQLCKVLDLNSDKASITVNDWGCGYGAMFKYLDELEGIRLGHYYGYDISEKMLEAARGFIDDPRAEMLHSGAVTNEADYTFVSGTFNVKFETDYADWKDFIFNKIKEIDKYSRRGFAFNLLSKYVDWEESHLFYGDPLEIFDFCKRHISRHVTLLHDYPLYEWTIYVKK